jgi:hypothetical protein
MNWEMLAALAQLAAVFVGIPSLIYLALQIRAQTKERRQAAVHALTEEWGDVAAAVHDNIETAAIYLHGMQSFTDLDPLSKLRFSAFFHRLLNVFEGMYFSHCQGILADSSWAAVERTLSDMIAYPGLQQWGGNSASLAHRRIRPCRRCDYCPRREAESVLNLRSQQD